MTFTVSIPAPDRNLLTLAEMKDALGITDSASDAKLETLGLQLSDLISDECCIPSDGVNIPTHRSETIVETFRLNNGANPLIISRRFVSWVASITEDGTELSAADFAIERAGGLLSRLDSSGGVICWTAREVIVTYDAGFAIVPATLKLAATTVLREQWSAARRDPLLRRDSVYGVGEREYWVDSSSGSGTNNSALSGQSSAMLNSYRYYAI